MTTTQKINAPIAIVGPSGSGKTTSLQQLDLSKTIIFDLERKGMPFRIKPEHTTNIIPIESLVKFEVEYKKALSRSEITIIVVDSFSQLTNYVQNWAEGMYKGYDIWKFHNKKIGELLESFKITGKQVIITGIDEVVQMVGVEGQQSSQRRIGINGKEWRGLVESQCLIVIFTFAKRLDSKMNYYFATQTDGITSAKSPAYMNIGDPVEYNIRAVLDVVEKG